MTSYVNRIENALKAKEDMQSFVLITFFLFVVFVKCYTMVTIQAGTARVGIQKNAVMIKTEAIRPI